MMVAPSRERAQEITSEEGAAIDVHVIAERD
jgi:hypothetical protein